MACKKTFGGCTAAGERVILASVDFSSNNENRHKGREGLAGELPDIAELIFASGLWGKFAGGFFTLCQSANTLKFCNYRALMK